MGALLVAAWSLAVASCSDGDGDADETTVAPVTEQPVTSAALETVPPITEPPVTTTSTTTTTIAPTTTFDPAEELARQVEADYREGLRLIRVAQQDVGNPDAVAAALSYVSGESRAAVESSFEDFRQNGLRILPEPIVDPTITIEEGPTQVEGLPGTVELTACEIDPWILVETGAGPGGSDAIVDDEVYAYRNQAWLESDGGRWVVSSSTEVGRWVGAQECPDS